MNRLLQDINKSHLRSIKLSNVALVILHRVRNFLYHLHGFQNDLCDFTDCISPVSRGKFYCFTHLSFFHCALILVIYIED